MSTSRLGTGRSSSLDLGELIGGRLTWLSVSTVEIGLSGQMSEMRSASDSFDISFSGTIGPVDITASGANGLDAGTEAANTWYAVHVIFDSSGTNSPAGLFSLSATSPTLPAGYDAFRRVGWVRNDSSSDLRAFYQRGDGLDRTYNYDVDRSGLIALSAGTSTIYAAVDLSEWMPTTSQFCLLVVSFDAANAGDILDIRPTGSSVSNPVVFVQEGTVSISRNTSHVELITPSQSVDYRITLGGGSAADVDLYVQGFRDSLRF